MERLAHRITMEVQAGKWNLIHLRGEGLALSHLFFVDDLVLFCQAEVSQVTLIKNFLEEFSALSGHKVNARKTQVCFSSNVEDESTDSLASLLRFQRVNDHGRYLGAPPFQKRIMRRDFHFVIDKIRSRLNGWDAKLLSMVRRVTLAKSVMMTMPNYFMRTTLIPIGVCTKLKNL